eukprot:CAMPEP_0117056618 /NCGR_PEP_ID=MMETSP0472-20121206/39288_1 /TAXON_ID=693140 ORGANISM="Tiarina fusus, Strain LIS" /NCGR_SAMPLE_ID=MMETSP0472 /ASSEMBLY_ACC=CAM_ASM_000603 /LENGTH=418 /DNA_ID=CAMNT_0004773147 /DNA_START=259 /DNA_END=1515 /DNA_ORIENTATION=-
MKFFTTILLGIIIAAVLPHRTNASTLRREHSLPNPNVDWDSFSFGLNGVRTDSMWVNVVDVNDDTSVGADDCYSSSSETCLKALGHLELSPAATVLNYGQALFEGMKAFRRADGSIAMFRPERNALRMQQGAKRFLMPSVPTDVFVEAADAVVRANARWVPPFGKGALYLRPLLMGTGDDLGVKPSWQTTFCIYCSPVGNYFKGGLKAIHLQAVQGFSRAARGGAGSVKASGNYAPAFLVQKQVKQQGYDEVLCLDAATGQAVEEAGASNFFAVYPNNTIVTPSLDSETILPGVTRSSIIELARRECGCTVLEQRLTLEDIRNHGACEAFCCGTGASITPVGSITVTRRMAADEDDASADGDSEAGDDDESNRRIEFGDGSTPGPLTQRLYNMLLDLQTGVDQELNEKYQDWIHVVEP